MQSFTSRQVRMLPRAGHDVSTIAAQATHSTGRLGDKLMLQTIVSRIWHASMAGEQGRVA